MKYSEIYSKGAILKGNPDSMLNSLIQQPTRNWWK